MFYIFVFLFGFCVGAIAANLYLYVNAGYGLFSLRESNPEDPEFHDLTIRIGSNQYLLDKKKIILKRETQK